MDETYEEEEEDDDSMSQDATTVFNKSETVNSSDNTSECIVS